MDYIILLSSNQETTDYEELGGKGRNLVLLNKNGFNVPSGMIITTKVFDKIMSIHRKNSEMPLKLPTWLKDDLSGLWNKYFTGKSVVVRSSANLEDSTDFSFAGQFKSILNIRSSDKFLEAVEDVYNSLFGKPIIEYCNAHSIKYSKLKMAIVVQEFINGELSGVLFTKDPITGKNSTIIEAVIGLNQGLVSGIVTPTKFIVNNDTLKKVKIERRIQQNKMITDNGSVEIRKNNARVADIFSPESIKKLVEWGLKAERIYGKPQDIEWTIFNGEIYILQSRNITTVISAKADSQKIGRAFRGYPASPGFVIGKAKIVDSDNGSFDMNNLILVTEHTDTDMLPYMKSAKAIITEEGGTLSHAAIVSRELGIPCVVGIKNARKRIKNGATIAVDGNNGFVYTSMTLPERVIGDQKLDEARLYCFDKMKEFKYREKMFYYEKFGKNVVYYTTIPIRLSVIRSALRNSGLDFKTLTIGNRDKAALASRYYLTLQDPQERRLYQSGINVASRFDGVLLNQKIREIIVYAETNVNLLKKKSRRNETKLLESLLAAYRAFSAYILINTMICEGYGYRNLYYNLIEILKKHKIDYLHFLYDIDREEKIEEFGNLTQNEKRTMIKAIEYYKTLKTWRKDSYPIFKDMGITGDLLRPLLSELTDQLKATTGKNLNHREWFAIAVKKHTDTYSADSAGM